MASQPGSMLLISIRANAGPGKKEGHMLTTLALPEAVGVRVPLPLFCVGCENVDSA